MNPVLPGDISIFDEVDYLDSYGKVSEIDDYYKRNQNNGVYEDVGRTDENITGVVTAVENKATAALIKCTSLDTSLGILNHAMECFVVNCVRIASDGVVRLRI